MPDNKLTDNEIKKALECCVMRENKCCNNRQCPFFYETETYAQCRELLKNNALDLINRLQAENEKLREIVLTDRSEAIKKLKAEAYKECIEKVKSELGNIAKIDWQDNYYYLVGTAFFDNLLKEILGE